MVSGSQRTHHWYSRWRVWSWRSDHCTRSYVTYSKRWRADYVCVFGHRLSDRDGCCGLVHAESAGGLETRRVDANRVSDLSTRWTRLHARRGVEDLAVVCALATPVSQHVRRHF